MLPSNTKQFFSRAELLMYQVMLQLMTLCFKTHCGTSATCRKGNVRALSNKTMASPLVIWVHVEYWLCNLYKMNELNEIFQNTGFLLIGFCCEGGRKTVPWLIQDCQTASFASGFHCSKTYFIGTLTSDFPVSDHSLWPHFSTNVGEGSKA